MTHKFNINIIIMFFVLAAFSCKKDQSNKQQPGSSTPDSKLYNVTVKIGGNNFAQASAARAGKLNVNAIVGDLSQFKNYFDTLYINLGDSLYRYSTKNLTSINVTQKLTRGLHYINVFGAQKGMFLDYNLRTAAYTPTSNRSGNYTIDHWKDSFYTVQGFTIVDSDLNLTVNLARINAALEINLTDALPQNVVRFTVQSSVNFNTMRFDTGNYLDVYNEGDHPRTEFSVNVPDSLKGKPNFKIDYYTLYFGSFNATIKAYDKNGFLITSKTINNVQIGKGQKTIYTGSLFGTITPPNNLTVNSGFTISTDPDWNPNQVIKNF